MIPFCNAAIGGCEVSLGECRFTVADAIFSPDGTVLHSGLNLVLIRSLIAQNLVTGSRSAKCQ